MQRIFNKPEDMVDEMIAGFVKAYPDRIGTTSHARVLRYKKAPVPNKVGIVTGGGSGHESAFIGYIGSGLCDSVAVGEIFTSPPATAFYEAFKSADSGEGVVCLYGNYAGDNMNVKIAVEMAEDDGIVVKTVVANDDAASAPKNDLEKRRGVAGEIFMWKVGGAKASMGGTIDEVVSVAKKSISQTRSIGIGLSACTIPEVGHSNFTIKENSVEVGIGHHGEAGIEVVEMQSSEELAKIMVDKLLKDLPYEEGDDVAVLVSGLGAMPVMELYILYNTISALLSEAGITIYKNYIGNYFTSLEMNGATLTLLKLDEELRVCLDYPCDSLGLTELNTKGND